MQAGATVGLNIAKSVFQVHGADAAGNVLIRRQLKRRYVLSFFEKLPRFLVGIEACATSHHWARELARRRIAAVLRPVLEEQAPSCLTPTQAQAYRDELCRLAGRALPMPPLIDRSSPVAVRSCEHKRWRQTATPSQNYSEKFAAISYVTYGPHGIIPAESLPRRSA
jgi:transposase